MPHWLDLWQRPAFAYKQKITQENEWPSPSQLPFFFLHLEKE